LYRESGHSIYYSTYEYWIKDTLNKIDKEIADNADAANPIGLLEGWAGVAMVLTEFIYHGEAIKWDKAFLL
jgi:lantibiotic biosynthesis protein